jgi:hypothetical protein
MLQLQYDEYSRYSLSKFHKHKDDFIEALCVFIHKLTDKGKAVEYIEMENSGKNKKLVESATGNEWKLNPKLEFMTCSTPQLNGFVEVEFATIAGCAMTMCNVANMNNVTQI